MTSLLLLVAMYVPALVVHEAGHAAAWASLRLPWRVTLTRFGPAIVGGSSDIRLRPWQVQLTAACGPAANIGLAAVAYKAGASLLVLASLECGIVNLLPIPRSDGSRILRPRRALRMALAEEATTR